MGIKILESDLGEEAKVEALTIQKGATFICKFVIKNIPTSGIGLITADNVASAAMQIREGYGGALITGCDFSSGGGSPALAIDSTQYSNGQLTVTLTLSHTATAALSAAVEALAGNSSLANGSAKVKLGVYDLELTTAASNRWRPYQGDAYLSFEVTQ